MDIPFNKPYLTGKETDYIKLAVESGKISGNGMYTKKCHSFFHSRFGLKKCLLTTSCTDALEMAAILCNLKQGDEVILPAFTFVSTANAFILRGAKPVFVDSRADHPGIDESKIEELITSRTKAIIPVHYAGVACDMDIIMDIANRFQIIVVEDAAQAVDSGYKGGPLGGIGQLGCFSFHETKNIQCGEGGMLSVNDEAFFKRAEIIWEKGTNRTDFFRGEVNKYEWVDIGSSFLPSEIIAGFLFAQIENLDLIQVRRKQVWKQYYDRLKPLEEKGYLRLPFIPDYASNNAHMLYIVLNNLSDREEIISHLKKAGVMAVFHYLSLHTSSYYKLKHDGRILKNSDHYSDCLLRLPMYYEITNSQVDFICDRINDFFTLR
jgi:dTDP-4-amino-4,6-dideoxygalactose transaminase